jgi:3-methyladenine DNA glycosylase AlkD
MTATDVQRALSAQANPARAALSQRYFKTGPGEYGAGDVFLGLTVPQQRRVARQFADLPASHIQRLLRSPIHEERLVALFILVRRFERGDRATRERSVRLYRDNFRHINNWDLVDVSAPRLLGAWLSDRKRALLYRLARSKNLWERRIALLATLDFIRQGAFEDTLTIAAQLLEDREDLIHKAAGWMLREVGKRDLASLAGFLDRYHARMPRTMLRYAIERLPKAQRQHYLQGGRFTASTNASNRTRAR